MSKDNLLDNVTYYSNDGVFQPVKNKFFRQMAQRQKSIYEEQRSFNWEEGFHTHLQVLNEISDQYMPHNGTSQMIVWKGENLLGFFRWVWHPLANYCRFDLHLWGDAVEMEGLFARLENKYGKWIAPIEVPEYQSYIEWKFYDNMKNLQSVTLPNKPKPTFKSFYPYVAGESLEEYFDAYMKSSATVLVLLGEPGTGKTNFIRTLLNHSRQNTVLTYDPKMFENDIFFISYITGDENMLVFEDADAFLSKRSEGNDMMHKFLNISDGLVSSMNKKIIFSTNLKDTSMIDPALLRKGRCFDVVKFRKLNETEAEAAAKDAGVELKKNDTKQYRLADVFNQGNDDSEVIMEPLAVLPPKTAVPVIKSTEDQVVEALTGQSADSFKKASTETIPNSLKFAIEKVSVDAKPRKLKSRYGTVSTESVATRSKAKFRRIK